jgi:hypothetical protein
LVILVVVVGGGAVGFPVAAAVALGDATVAADVAGRALVAVAGETVADFAAVFESAVAGPPPPPPFAAPAAAAAAGFLPRICATSSGIGYGFLNV